MTNRVVARTTQLVVTDGVGERSGDAGLARRPALIGGWR